MSAKVAYETPEGLLAAIPPAFADVPDIIVADSTFEVKFRVSQRKLPKDTRLHWTTISEDLLFDIHLEVASPSEWYALLPAYLRAGVFYDNWPISWIGLYPMPEFAEDLSSRYELLTSDQLEVVHSYVYQAFTKRAYEAEYAWTSYWAHVQE